MQIEEDGGDWVLKVVKTGDKIFNSENYSKMKDGLEIVMDDEKLKGWMTCLD